MRIHSHFHTISISTTCAVMPPAGKDKQPMSSEMVHWFE
jgi:hypothetical protein